MTKLDYVSELCKLVGLVLERTMDMFKGCTKVSVWDRQKALWEFTRGIQKKVEEQGSFPVGRKVPWEDCQGRRGRIPLTDI